MKLHYFDTGKVDDDDYLFQMAINQGYVPKTCLLGGVVIMSEMNNGNDPCKGCNCDRSKCQGRDMLDLREHANMGAREGSDTETDEAGEERGVRCSGLD